MDFRLIRLDTVRGLIEEVVAGWKRYHYQLGTDILLRGYWWLEAGTLNGTSRNRYEVRIWPAR
jgi:hypothetical protein